MLVVCLTHAGDIAKLHALLEWIANLGEYKSHDCLIVADAGTAALSVMEAHKLASGIFREARVTSNAESVKGWPAGCYSLFTTATEYVAKEWPQPFLILEPDAVPLKPGWLDFIERDYKACGQPFMGHIYKCEQPALPRQLMSGIAVYPANTFELLPKRETPVHWDVDGAEMMVSHGADTKLIQHLFGEMALPPTFVDVPFSGVPGSVRPPHPIPLSWIPPEACIFHRDKTHSLIRLLERRYAPRPSKPIICVFNVSPHDIDLAIHHARWLVTLMKRNGKPWAHTAVLAHDPSADAVKLNTFQALLRQCFERVDVFVYSMPHTLGYPAAANWSWQSTAIHMSSRGQPWLWIEADAVVLRENWIDQIQSAYDRCGKSWFGPHVKQLGHSNGGMVYPSDAADRMPTAMRLINEGAFDYSGSQEYMHDCADASALLCHIWTIMNDEASPVGGGQIPANVTPERARRWIPKSSVMVHRIKCPSLVNILQSGEYKP